MQYKSSISASWQQAILAILPGLFILGSKMEIWQRTFRLGSDAWLFNLSGVAIVCLLLCFLNYVLERRIAVWSYPALGIALQISLLAMTVTVTSLLGLFLIILLAIIAYRLHWISFELGLLGFIAVGTLVTTWLLDNPTLALNPSEKLLQSDNFFIQLLNSTLFLFTISGVFAGIVGYYFSRQSGVLASLISLGSSFIVLDLILDPDYALQIWLDDKLLLTFVSSLPSLGLLVITPILAMRFSSKVRVVSLLLPTCIALGIVAMVDTQIRPYGSLTSVVLNDLFLILLPLFVVVWAFNRVTN